MKHAGQTVLLALFLALLTGCASKKAKVQPPSAAQAPTTNDQVRDMSLSPLSNKPEAPVLPPASPVQAQATTPPPPPPEHKPSPRKKTNAAKPKPSAAKPVPAPVYSEPGTTAAPATTPAPVAVPSKETANVEPSGASPIGQLSSGQGAAGSQKRHETSDLINITEQKLNGIKRSLSTQESETTNQIRTYIKQARHALTVDDIDGASTLATKAKVLLEELTKP